MLLYRHSPILRTPQLISNCQDISSSAYLASKIHTNFDLLNCRNAHTDNNAAEQLREYSAFESATEKPHTEQHASLNMSTSAWEFQRRLHWHYKHYKNENLLFFSRNTTWRYKQCPEENKVLLPQLCVIVIDGCSCLTGKSIEQMGNCQVECF